MDKLIIFDLDGVLVEAKKIHFDALNMSLEEIDKNLIISWEEHLRIFDGLKTIDKLEILIKLKSIVLKDEELNYIFKKKQEYTMFFLDSLIENVELVNLLTRLKNENFKLACCSNSIRQTVILVLKRLGILDLFDLVLSNEDVQFAKPFPEIYWKAMSHFGVSQENTLIVEDSPAGLTAAYKSGAKVLRVKTSCDFDYELLMNTLHSNKQTLLKWVDKKMNVLIPMAGLGSRFSKAGFTFPKPLIEINGKPMIQIVIENLALEANFIFIVQKSHRLQYNLDSMLSVIAPNCTIIETDGVTEGAACTALLAKNIINNENPLLIANSDQFIDWNSLDFFYKMNEQNLDGGILTFTSTHPKWSYVKNNSDGFVCEVAEKKPISNQATVGIYYWKHGSEFCKYAETMISNNDRINNEFYICPVYNYAIYDNLKIKTHAVAKMWGLGTPEDLDYFVRNFSV